MKTHFIKHSLLFLALPLLWIGCIKEDYVGPDPELSSRTVLVYIAGDNNLSELSGAVEEIRRAWTYTGNRCIVYYDAEDAPPVLLSLRGGCRVTPIPYVETIAEYPEENSASAEVFSRVLRDVVRMYPADSYGLVYASHATGWLPEDMSQDTNRIAVPRSLGKDCHTGTLADGSSEMELCDFAAAIPDGQFEFIIFEACLMGGVEVAYELRNKTRYILASSAELLASGFIPVYAQAFGYLMNSGLAVDESLCKLAEAYYRYIDIQSGDARSTTLSIIATEKIDALADCMKNILLFPASPFMSSECEKMQHFDRQIPARYFDLDEYVEKIASPQNYGQFLNIMKETVVWKAATPAFMRYSRNGFIINRHCGLTTYIEYGAYPRLDEAHQQTAWYKAIHRENDNNKITEDE